MVKERKTSLWTRSVLLRIICYSMASSVFICIVMEFCWSLNPPESLRNLEQSPLEAHLRAVSMIAFGIFWSTFALVGSILGLQKVKREAPQLFRKVLILLIGAGLLVSVVLLIFVIPFWECPNCSAPAEKQTEGTLGIIENGKYVTVGCWNCNGRRVTLYRKWKWRESGDGR